MSFRVAYIIDEITINSKTLKPMISLKNRLLAKMAFMQGENGSGKNTNVRMDRPIIFEHEDIKEKGHICFIIIALISIIIICVISAALYVSFNYQ